MDTILETFNYFDIGAVALLFFLAIRGLVRGMRKELAGACSALGGLFGAWHFYPKVSEFIMQNTRVEDTLAANAIAFIASMLLLSAGIRLLFLIFDKLMEYSFSSGVDRTGGFIVGFVQGLLTVAMMVIVAMLLPSEVLKKHIIDESKIGSWGEKVLPEYYNKLADETPFLPELEEQESSSTNETAVVEHDPAKEVPAGE